MSETKSFSYRVADAMARLSIGGLIVGPSAWIVGEIWRQPAVSDDPWLFVSKFGQSATGVGAVLLVMVLLWVGAHYDELKKKD